MSTAPVSVTITALPGIPLIGQGDDLVHITLEALAHAGLSLQNGDVLVIVSTVVSKAEGRIVSLKSIEPSEEARQLAAETLKDPRIVELILRESGMVSRKAKGVLVTQHRLGFVSANSGIDQSNVDGTGENVLLLPADPDASAARIRQGLCEETGVEVGIIISDTHGRPFRMGNVGVAIGVAGMPALLDLRGKHDLYGRVLQASVNGFADLVASAAHLVCGEADEGLPVVLVRGLQFTQTDGRASDMIRPPDQDLYR